MQSLSQSPTDPAFVQDPYAFYDRARALALDLPLACARHLRHQPPARE